ncbi:MAG: hypothetical protein AMS27_08875 [Bacteroides sp. SM23_62_1]|nr:MAG: hypothetical protein AMS27_08875 [Bacteroides sp. SM23_62_1]
MIRMAPVMAIAGAEARVIRRLVRYWVFLSLSYLGILIAYFYYGIIHGLFSSYSASVGIIQPRYLMGPVSVLYLLIYLAGCVFLGFDVRARDVRERMNEVLDSRPYSNQELVFGRFLGVFLPSWIPMVAIMVLLEFLGILLLYLGSPVGDIIEIMSVFSVVFRMAIPAMAFALAFVFLVTLLVRNRLVAAILLLVLLGGDIWIMSTVLPVNYISLIDFTGAVTSIIPSDIAPVMSDLPGWVQRFAVLIAAIGMLILSAAVHPRLDGGSRARTASMGAGIIILAVILTALVYYQKAEDINKVEYWKEAHALHKDVAVPDLKSISGMVKIEPGDDLVLDLDLAFKAPDHRQVKQATFTLNPGQEVKKVLDASGQPLEYKHENGLLDITLPRALGAGEGTTLHLNITGIPDKRFAYLESAFRIETIKAGGSGNVIGMMGTERVFFDPRFVALMPGARWLPAPGPETGRDDPRHRDMDYYNVDLVVEVPEGWLVAGPGRRHTAGKGDETHKFRFSPPAPVPDVALIASRFESRSVEIEGLLLEVLIYEKHLKNLDIMAETGEHIRSWVGERLKEAKDNGLGYPYDGLTLVEVPNLLMGYGGGWRMDTVMSQPGILMMRELGFPTARFDSAFRKPEEFKNREGGLPKAKWERLRAFFINDITGGNVLSGAAKNFFLYQTSSKGKESLALNYVMENLSTLLLTDTRAYFSAHLLNSNINQLASDVLVSYFRNRVAKTTISDEVASIVTSRPGIWEKVLNTSLRDMDPWEDPPSTVDILTLKASAFARSILDSLGPEDTGRLLALLRETHRGQSYTMDDVVAAGNSLGHDLEKLFSDWFGSTALPGFVCTEARIFRLPDSDDGNPRYQLLITVRNDEPTTGLFRFAYYYPGEGTPGELVTSDPMSLEGKNSMRFGTVLSKPPVMLYFVPYLSLNREQFQVHIQPYDPGKIIKEKAIEGREDIPWAIPEDGSIIVDDLDPGFTVSEGENGSGFRLSAKEDEDRITDQGLPVAPFYARPADWSRITTRGSYGKYRHTLAAIGAGKGEKEATFTATLPGSGSWDLDLHVPPKDNVFLGAKWGNWNLLITDKNGDEHEMAFDSNAAIPGWNLTGSLELPEGEVSIALSDKSDGQVIVADAIRWSPSAGN